MLRMVTLARTAQISACQDFQDFIDTDVSYPGLHGFVCVCDPSFAGHIVGVGGTKIDSARFCGEKGG